MAWVTVSLGSNIEAGQNIVSGLDALQDKFGELIVSEVFESEAVGFEGDNFLNLAAAFNTDLEVAALSRILKQIEDENGRDRSQPKFGVRTLDIDLLTYDEWVGVFSGIVLPREEITENAFVLWPLAQIHGDGIHPRLKQSYNELWAAYDKGRQLLWPIDFQWQGRIISQAGDAAQGA